MTRKTRNPSTDPKSFVSEDSTLTMLVLVDEGREDRNATKSGLSLSARLLNGGSMAGR